MHTVWKTIQVGTGPLTPVDAWRALENHGYEYRMISHGVLTSMTMSQDFIFRHHVEDVDLVIKTVAELGLGPQATLDQIWHAAYQIGLQICPPDVGIALRLQYPDQPDHDVLRIMMQPIYDSHNEMHDMPVYNIFILGSKGGVRWIDGERWSRMTRYNLSDRLVFVQPR